MWGGQPPAAMTGFDLHCSLSPPLPCHPLPLFPSLLPISALRQKLKLLSEAEKKTDRLEDSAGSSPQSAQTLVAGLQTWRSKTSGASMEMQIRHCLGNMPENFFRAFTCIMFGSCFFGNVLMWKLINVILHGCHGYFVFF